MEDKIFKVLDNITIGETQTFRNMTVLPLSYQNGNKLSYLSLNTALKNDYITIKELDEGASVSELKVINHSKYNVLIIDGEQFVGAKQNRIINASVFVAANSKLIISVSCVEEGRWHDVSDKFMDSDNIITSAIRAKKFNRVTESLKEKKIFMSDQGEIWDDVHEFLSKANVVSPTGALEDFFKFKKNDNDLKKYIDSFSLEDAQNGIIVFINNEPAGIEYISDTSVFTQNFSKIIKSFAVSAQFSQEKYKETGLNVEEQGRIFLNNFNDCDIEMFKSLGLGNDFRLSSTKVSASALVVEDELVHFVGFPFKGNKRKRRMKPFNLDNDFMQY